MHINNFPLELLAMIIHFCFTSEKIVITDAPISNRIKTICRHWNDVYKFLFKHYGTKYILIEPFNNYLIKPYIFVPFTVSIENYDKPTIIINYLEEKTQLNLSHFKNSKNYYALVTKEEFENFKSICDLCKLNIFCFLFKFQCKFRNCLVKHCHTKELRFWHTHMVCFICRNKFFNKQLDHVEY